MIIKFEEKNSYIKIIILRNDSNVLIKFDNRQYYLYAF
jgi:hypothetical protein